MTSTHPTAARTNHTGGLAATRRGGGLKRVKDDFYATPTRATEALLAVERFPFAVWEPACGNGAISRVLEARGYVVYSTDLIDRGYGLPRHDFLLEQAPRSVAVITNPPFSVADDFALHALQLGAPKVAMFLRSAYLEGAARHKRVFSKYPPIRMWQFSRRVTLWRGDDPNPQDKGGAIAFAWFVWEQGFAGSPTLGWLP